MNLSRGNKIKYIIYTGLIITAIFLFKNIAQTETQTGNINVDMNVLATTTPPVNPPGGGGTEYPEILIIASTTEYNSATFSWEINFKHTGPNTTTIAYGKDTNYSSSTAVSVSGTLFTAELENLETDTIYYFKIIATNGAPVTAEKYGTFKTQKAIILNSLTILAKPEKRFLENGPNYSSNATLFFLDQTATNILTSFKTVLNDSGSTTVFNQTVKEGTDLVVMLKTDSHLAKRLNGVDTTKGNLTLDFTVNKTAELLAGDITSDGLGNLQNNFLITALNDLGRDDVSDIQDVSTIDLIFRNKQYDGIVDLDKDNTVDAADIMTALYNFQQKNVGDLKISADRPQN